MERESNVLQEGVVMVAPTKDNTSGVNPQVRRGFVADWNDATYREHVFVGMRNAGMTPEFAINPFSVLERARELNLMPHLTPDQFSVLQNRFCEFRNQAETARVLGKSENAVSKIERNGLHRLERYIGRREIIDIAWEQGFIDCLMPCEREVLYARYYEGKSTRATAKETSRNPHTVSSMEIRGLQKLKKLLSAQDAS